MPFASYNVAIEIITSIVLWTTCWLAVVELTELLFLNILKHQNRTNIDIGPISCIIAKPSLAPLLFVVNMYFLFMNHLSLRNYRSPRLVCKQPRMQQCIACALGEVMNIYEHRNCYLFTCNRISVGKSYLCSSFTWLCNRLESILQYRSNKLYLCKQLQIYTVYFGSALCRFSVNKDRTSKFILEEAGDFKAIVQSKHHLVINKHCYSLVVDPLC